MVALSASALIIRLPSSGGVWRNEPMWWLVPKRTPASDSLPLRPKSMWFSTTCRPVWSWPSPPATLTASTGRSSLKTSVGVSVIRGRLPGTMQFG